MRPITFSLNPLAADADAFATKVQPVASGFMVMASTAAKVYATDIDRDAFCQAQTPSGAVALTMDGILAKKQLNPPRVVTLYATHDTSADNYTIVGLDTDGRGLAEVIAGPNNATIRTANVFAYVDHVACDAGATDVVEIGAAGFGLPSESVRVLFTTTNDESGVGFTLHGLDNDGNYVKESGTLPNNSTLISNNNFTAIIGLDLSSALTSTVQLGIANQKESKWYRMDPNQGDINVNVALSSSASFNYAIQWTQEDIYSTEFTATRQLPTSPFVHTVTGPGSATDASAYSLINGPVTAVRVAIDTFASGALNGTIVQRRYV